jgi:antitoxin MazE
MPHIIQIGNSLGVRIPKAIIQELGFKANTNLVFKVTEDGLLLSTEKQAREGWEQRFKAPKKRIKNPSLLGEFPNDFDNDEWKW